MKRLLIMCGAGHATSTVVRTKVEQWLKDEGLAGQVEIVQSAVTREVDNIAAGAYDAVVSTTQVPDSIKGKVVMGVPLLTGFGTEPVFAAVKAQLGL